MVQVDVLPTAVDMGVQDSELLAAVAGSNSNDMAGV
jgi:hypothetical protein